MPPKILEILLEACTDLRSFKFVRMGSGTQVSHDNILEMTKSDAKTLFELHMAPALAYCKHSLEELVLSFTDDWPPFYHMEFQDFNQLRKFEIDRTLLADDSSTCLPPSLEYLKLRGFDLEEAFDGNRSFWRNIQAAANCPVLKIVSLIGVTCDVAIIKKLTDLAEHTKFGHHFESCLGWVEHRYTYLFTFEENDVQFIVENEGAKMMTTMPSPSASSLDSSESSDSSSSSDWQPNVDPGAGPSALPQFTRPLTSP
jgi:hypothetical protein